MRFPRYEKEGLYPSAIEKRMRSERALVATLAERYVPGVSTRKVKAIPEELCGVKISAEQVSRATAQMIDHSQVRSDLEAVGYKFIAFQSSYDGTTIQDVDELVTRKKNPLCDTVTGYLNPFEEMFLNTTATTMLFRLPLNRLYTWMAEIRFAYADEAQTQLYQLDTLPKVAAEPGPKFVFMHMNIPHQPFILKADGSLQIDPDYYTRLGEPKDIRGYLDQKVEVTFVFPNDRIRLHGNLLLSRDVMNK